jgi:hypothetical protein
MQAKRDWLMTDDSDDKQTKREILAAARRQLGWRKLTLERRGSRWIATAIGRKSDTREWEAVPRANEQGKWWFIREN